MTEQQLIIDSGDLRKYRTELPNMADDELDPFQYRLYAHYKRVCGGGNGGYCSESVRTTAGKTKMSYEKVISTRQWLQDEGWIDCEQSQDDGRYKITIADRWAENFLRYTPDEVIKKVLAQKSVRNSEQGVRNLQQGVRNSKREVLEIPNERNNYTKKELDKKEPEGDHTVLDHPAAQPTQPPTPTAALPEKRIAIADPGKPEEPKPIRGGATQPVQPVKNLGHLPINGYNHRQAGNDGFEGLMQAARDNANGSGYKSPEKEQADIYTAEMKALGVEPAEFTKMVNVLLAATKKLATVERYTNERSVRILNDHKAAIRDAASTWEAIRSAKDVKMIIDSFFAENKNFAGGAIHLSQFIDQSANMAQDASKPKPPAPAPAVPDFRVCTIVDVPTPAPTAAQVADKAAQELSQAMVNIRAVVGNWGSWLKVPAGMRANWLPKIMEYNAANPNTPVMFAGMEKDLAG